MESVAYKPSLQSTEGLRTERYQYR